ncbi:hypothetical protein [Desulfocastanea catecholica]
MDSRKFYSAHAVKKSATKSRRAVRKHLNIDTLLALVREEFNKIPDIRADNAKIASR